MSNSLGDLSSSASYFGPGCVARPRPFPSECVAMSTVRNEISQLEERLRLAELGPDPAVFEELLDDDVILTGEDGRPLFAKQKVVEAHRPGRGPKFTRVDITDVQIVEHGAAAVVTCTGTFDGPQGTFTLKFLRVWVRKDGKWRIVAGSVGK